MAQADVMTTIKHYQKSIEDNADNPERLLHCVKRLSRLPITINLLSETGIGKTINLLRKHDGKLGKYANELVLLWKQMVLNEDNASYDASQNDQQLVKAESINGTTRHERHPHKAIEYNISHEEKHKSKHHKSKNGIIEQNCTELVKYQENKKHKDKHDKDKSHKSSRHSKSDKEDKLRDEKDKEMLRKLEKEKEKERHREREREKEQERERERERQRERELELERQREQELEKEREKEREREREREREKNRTKSHHRESDKKKEHKDRHKEKSSESHENERSDKDDHKSNSKSDKRKDKDKSSKKRKHDDQLLESKPDKHKSQEKSKERLHSAEDAVEKATSSRSSNEHKNSNIFSKHDTSSGDTSKSGKKRKRENGNQSNEEEEIDGIDSSMGANFEDVLGMLNAPSSKKSKKSITKQSIAETVSNTPKKKESSSKTLPSPSSSSSNHRHNERPSTSSSLNTLTSKKPELLASSVKLEPLDPSIALDLPMISNNYKPLPVNQSLMSCIYNSQPPTSKAPLRLMSDSEALSHSIQSKTIRTKVYSGTRTGQTYQPSSLFLLCVRMLQKNIDALEFTGGVPFEVMRPVLEKASADQLYRFEEFNPYIIEDTDELWKYHVQRNYRSHKREEMESWREMFLRCREEQERRLSSLTESIKQSTKNLEAPVRKTQLAFVDSLVKPPRNIQRKQEIFGTKSKVIATPAARVAALQNVTPNAAQLGDARLRVAQSARDNAQAASRGIRPKKAPLMQKTLQFMRGRNKR